MNLFKFILIAIVQSFFMCGGQVLLKLATAADIPFSWTWEYFRVNVCNWWMLLSAISFILAFLLWLYMLKLYPFSIAYPLTALCYIFGMLASLVIFKEPVAWAQWLGVLLIVAGSALIAR